MKKLQLSYLDTNKNKNKKYGLLNKAKSKSNINELCAKMNMLMI